MFILSETFGALRPRKIAEFATEAEAVAAAEKIGLVMIEADSDNPGCYDAFALDGRLLTIEPAGFKLEA